MSELRQTQTDVRLGELAALLRQRNEVDERIAAIVGRPAQIGHIGEFIAAMVFDIELHHSAVHSGSDGIFRSGPLAHRSVNIKWYAQDEGLLDVSVKHPVDLYLILAGPRSSSATSRGRTRPWLISSAFMFNHEHLVAALIERGVKLGVATSVRRALWEAAEVYPNARSEFFRLSDEQREQLALFAAPR